MIRILYSLVWWIALPFVLVRLWWRGRKEPGYRQHIAERLGFYDTIPTDKPLIWVHAVSLGETHAAEPLIMAILEAYPNHGILLSHMTATGRAAGAKLFGHLAPRVFQRFLPYDTGCMMRRFLRHHSPCICILMETEIWPNLIAQCAAHNVPVTLVNARMSARSLSRARWAFGLMKDAAAGIACVAAQTHADAERLRAYGARRVEITGSVKFDAAPAPVAVDAGKRLRVQFGDRPVLLCASTRDGEESLLLDALQDLAVEKALLLIVPRHPQRFDAVANLIAERGLSWCRRSQLDPDSPLPADVRVLLGDSMGEMFAYFVAADLAFIGGSLLPLGGQNLIEACAVGTPVLIGPHTFNFAAITEDAIAVRAALRIGTAADMMREASRLLRDADERKMMAESAARFAAQQRGATERTLALLRPYLDKPA